MRITRVATLVLIVLAFSAFGVTSGGAAGVTGKDLPVARHLMTAAAPVSAAEADDDIPTSPTLAPQPTIVVNNSLGDSDFDDVFRVYLYAGETYDISLAGDAGTDFGIYVFGPLATDVYEDFPDVGIDPAVWDASTPPYPRVLDEMLVTQSGYYYFNVFNWVTETDIGQAGNYVLTIQNTRPYTMMTVARPSTTTFGDAKAMTVQLDSRFFDLQGVVSAYFSENGSDFAPLYSQDYLESQTVTFTSVPQTQKTWYSFVYRDNDGVRTVAKTVWVDCYALTGTPVAPATMTRGRSATVYGQLWPRHAAGSYPVYIYKYRLVSGVWKPYGYVKAKASNYYDHSKYVASVSLPYIGKWKLRALAVADSGHLATWSSAYDYVTVK